MAKHKVSMASKAKATVSKYSSEFTLDHKGTLLCKLCNVYVSNDKTFMVESHRNSNKHKALLKANSSQPAISEFKTPDQNSWTYNVTKSFLEADIPLHKLNSPSIISLFKSINHPLPSHSSAYKTVDNIYETQMELIKNKMKDRKIFLVIDESDINGQKYINSLIGSIDNPQVTYLVRCMPIRNSPNTSTICQVVDDVLKEHCVERHNFLLLLCDAARYMVSAGNDLKLLYSKLFTVICIAHLLHNCALRVKCHFKNVDLLIASVKAATIENRHRQSLFNEIGIPPQPVVTRWEVR